MPQLLTAGWICRDHYGKRLLMLERRGIGMLAVQYPVLSELPLEVGASDLVPESADFASWRVLMLRRRAEQAARQSALRAASDAKPVRTAMVLCAGLGTRLRPLTNVYPKPAVPFFGAPLVRYSFALLKNAGVERLVINTHHLPEVMEQTARAEADRLGLSLAVSHEPVIQGTAGAIRDARKHLGSETFLLVNGDAFMSLDLRSLVAQHRASGAAATMAVTPMPVGESFGAVEAKPDGAVVRIGKPQGGGLTPWHFIGVHVLEPEVFDYVPPQGEQDINHVVYPAMIARGRAVRAAAVKLGAWGDMGTPARYLAACQEVMSGLCDLSAMGEHAPIGAEDGQRLRRAGFAGRSLIDRSAQVAPDAAVEQSQIGPGVEIGAGARVFDSCVLPGTRIAPGEVVEHCLASGALRLPALP